MKLDRRRKYYIILDTETATLPCAKKYEGKVKQDIALSKPLIYDIGWTLIDKNGKIYKTENFLISEIFSNIEIFNTAYFKDKRDIYINMLYSKKIRLATWRQVKALLTKDLQLVAGIGGYNSTFDFKKAIPFTDEYIRNIYSFNTELWLKEQEVICEAKAEGTFYGEKKSNYDKDFFILDGKKYPLFDVWGLSCKYLLNNDDYRSYCLKREKITESGKYYKTDAETVYQYLMGKETFSESHTALDDSIIETEIFAKVMIKTRKKIDQGIIFFPSKIIGEVKRE